MENLKVSERRVCQAIGHLRVTQRYPKKIGQDEILREQIMPIASQYGRYGYRRVTAMLRNDSWSVSHKRAERI